MMAFVAGMSYSGSMQRTLLTGEQQAQIMVMVMIKNGLSNAGFLCNREERYGGPLTVNDGK